MASPHRYGGVTVDAAQLKELQKRAGLSSALLAAILGVSTEAVRLWRGGHRPVPRYAVVAILLWNEVPIERRVALHQSIVWQPKRDGDEAVDARLS